MIGVNLEGKKDVLGIYTSENEGAKFWLQVLTQLQQRGVQDILIACIDNLKGFAEAIEAIFPDTEVQLCVVHQIRNSLKYVGSKHQKEFMRDLKPVYQAVDEEGAKIKLEALAEKWGKLYPVVIESWAKQLGSADALLPLPGGDPAHHLYDEHRRGLPQATAAGDQNQGRIYQRQCIDETVVFDHRAHHRKVDFAAAKLVADLLAVVHLLP